MDFAIATVQVQSKVLAWKKEHRRAIIPFVQTEGPMKTSLAHKISDDYVKFVAVTATPKAMTTREIEEALAQDEESSSYEHV